MPSLKAGTWRDIVNFMVFIVTALFGLGGVAWWSVLGSALLLTALNCEPWIMLWERAKKVARERAFAHAYLVSIVQNILFCGTAFGLGAIVRVFIRE